MLLNYLHRYPIFLTINLYIVFFSTPFVLRHCYDCQAANTGPLSPSGNEDQLGDVARVAGQSRHKQ